MKIPRNTFSLAEGDLMCFFNHLLNSSTDETKICVIRAKEFVHQRVMCIEKLFWSSKETRRVFFHYLRHQC